MTPAIIFLSLLLAANIWATRRVRNSDESPFKKKMLIIGVWVIPFMGAFMTKAHISDAHVNPTSYVPEPPITGIVTDAAPDELVIQGASSFPLLSNFGAFNGMPLLDWKAFSEWISSIDDATLKREAITMGKRAWLLHMRDALGPYFRLFESEKTFLLSPLENGVVVATAGYIAATRARIQKVLGGVANFPPDEKSILLVMPNEDFYYNYVAGYYPDEGEFAFSGGMFIDVGCPHFVVKLANLTAIEPVIAHEMTHSAVSYLKLPRWLDEGLAVNTEHRLTGVPRLIYTPHELRRMHQAFWDDEKIQEFWSGQSFHRTDDGNLLSYELARIMVEQMSFNWDLFQKFVMNAQGNDAGAQSANEQLNMDLGVFVCALLEKEHEAGWSPDPSSWLKTETE